jgi:acyl dehydratase
MHGSLHAGRAGRRGVTAGPEGLSGCGGMLRVAEGCRREDVAVSDQVSASEVSAGQVSYDDVKVGDELPAVTYPATRLSLVMYCGASGDFNVIHWNERIAKSVGLPNVIAHGMFTMAQAGRFVTDWAGPGATVAEFGVRFSAPVVVPDDDAGAEIQVTGKVEEKLADHRVALALTARSADTKVLSKARAVVRLP